MGGFGWFDAWRSPARWDGFVQQGSEEADLAGSRAVALLEVAAAACALRVRWSVRATISQRHDVVKFRRVRLERAAQLLRGLHATDLATPAVAFKNGDRVENVNGQGADQCFAGLPPRAPRSLVRLGFLGSLTGGNRRRTLPRASERTEFRVPIHFRWERLCTSFAVGGTPDGQRLFLCRYIGRPHSPCGSSKCPANDHSILSLGRQQSALTNITQRGTRPTPLCPCPCLAVLGAVHRIASDVQERNLALRARLIEDLSDDSTNMRKIANFL